MTGRHTDVYKDRRHRRAFVEANVSVIANAIRSASEELQREQARTPVGVHRPTRWRRGRLGGLGLNWEERISGRIPVTEAGAE